MVWFFQVMVELLGTYTTENASQAREEAQRCIVASLGDPQTFLLDRLLQLTPVKFLENELIHDLLKIFVTEKLESYQKFYENHREFVCNKLGLSHEANLRKMRILTFMQMAETQREISFQEIQKHMQIEGGDLEVEDFLIDCKCPCQVNPNTVRISRQKIESILNSNNHIP